MMWSPQQAWSRQLRLRWFLAYHHRIVGRRFARMLPRELPLHLKRQDPEPARQERQMKVRAMVKKRLSLVLHASKLVLLN